MKLDVEVNDPFDALKIQHLYSNPADLKLAAPRFKIPFCLQEWTEKLQGHPENCSLLFKLKEEIVGHTAFLPMEEKLFLCFVILKAECRAQGYSQDMILLSEEFCRLNYPHRELYLHVNQGNERALKLYTRLGYEICEVFKERCQMKKSLILSKNS